MSKKAAQRHQKAVASKERRKRREKSQSERRQSKRLHDAGEAAGRIQEVAQTAHAAAAFGSMMMAVAKTAMHSLQKISLDHKKTTGANPQCVRCRRKYPCATMQAVEDAVQQVHIDIGTTLGDPEKGFEMTKALLLGNEVHQDGTVEHTPENGAVSLADLAAEADAERSGPPPQEYVEQVSLGTKV